MQNIKVTAELLDQAGYSEAQIDRYFKLLARKQQHGPNAWTVGDRRFYNAARVAAAAAEQTRLAELRAATQRRLSGKNPVETKLHYRWVAAELEIARNMIDVAPGEMSALVIMLEEYLRALDKYQPVLDQIDTSKRHKFHPAERELLAIAAAEGYFAPFSHTEFKAQLKARFEGQWNSTWDDRYECGAYDNAIIPDTFELEYRALVRTEMERLTREVFPSVTAVVA